MARNTEKANSMLFRFRETKAAEMGMVSRTDKRPRIASQCTDLRQCERWRGELLKEVSRKVSKIQDQGLTDYEIRDINDEINRLLREKWHWENQIIDLGGANYRRAAPKMLNPDGTEVPGMRGYKYFGRAKDLPGVKELFDAQSAEAREQNSYKHLKETIFADAPPEYYGDANDKDEALLKAEREAEEEEWEEQWSTLANIIGLPEDTPCPPCPYSQYVTVTPQGTYAEPIEEESTETVTGGKRKAPSAEDEPAKKSKAQDGSAAATGSQKILTALRVQDLRGPTIPSMEEIEAAILKRQKEDLLREYVK